APRDRRSAPGAVRNSFGRLLRARWMPAGRLLAGGIGRLVDRDVRQHVVPQIGRDARRTERERATAKARRELTLERRLVAIMAEQAGEARAFREGRGRELAADEIDRVRRDPCAEGGMAGQP